MPPTDILTGRLALHRHGPGVSQPARVPEEASSEAYLPAQRPEALEAPWLPPSDVDACGARGGAGPSPKGSGPAVGLIWRIRDRATFTELRRRGRRRREGPISVTWVPGPDHEPPKVAFAIGRKVGSAVVRNRLRRRLRGAFVELAAAGDVRPGAYLITTGVAAAGLSYEELKTNVRTALEALGHDPSGPRRRS